MSFDYSYRPNGQLKKLKRLATITMVSDEQEEAIIRFIAEIGARLLYRTTATDSSLKVVRVNEVEDDRIWRSRQQ